MSAIKSNKGETKMNTIKMSEEIQPKSPAFLLALRP